VSLRAFILAVVIGLVVGWWIYKEPNVGVDQPMPEIKEVKIPPTSPPLFKKTIVAPPAVPMATVQSVTPPASAKQHEPVPPPAGHLEFEVHEGVAITQGDVVLGKVLDDNKAQKGIAKANRTKLWETNQIPYSIQEGVTNQAAIMAAIEQFHKETNVRFVPYSGQKDSVVFVKSEEICASYLGRVGGAQPIFLSPRCGAFEVMHELMHALGFVHEHSRPDRDKFLEVMWTNIEQKFWPQFWMIPDDLIHDYVGSVFSFDPQSIMLYDPTSFAKVPGTVTLRSKTNQELQPSRTTFSATDRERLFYLYSR